MVKIVNPNIPPELQGEFDKAVNIQNYAGYSRISLKKGFFSRKLKKNIIARSMLPNIAQSWAGLSEAEKTAWSNVAAIANLEGYWQMVQDTAKRKKAGLEGLSTPTTEHCANIGYLYQQTMDEHTVFIQRHNAGYSARRKIPGYSGRYEYVTITENVTLPLELKFNYKCEFSGEPMLRELHVFLWLHYLKDEVEHTISIGGQLTEQENWDNAEFILDELDGTPLYYDLYFHFYGCAGYLMYDNLQITHSGQNWAIDPFANDIARAVQLCPDDLLLVGMTPTDNAGAEIKSIFVE